MRSARLSLADLSLIIVESALLYTATVSVVLEKTNADYGVTDVVSHLLSLPPPRAHIR